jgi:hypothetical protein
MKPFQAILASVAFVDRYNNQLNLNSGHAPEHWQRCRRRYLARCAGQMGPNRNRLRIRAHLINWSRVSAYARHVVWHAGGGRTGARKVGARHPVPDGGESVDVRRYDSVVRRVSVVRFLRHGAA